jgi:hypothetical protein
MSRMRSDEWARCSTARGFTSTMVILAKRGRCEPVLKGGRPSSALALLALSTLICAAPASAVDVAVVKSWGEVSVFGELNSNWSAYGSVPLQIDTSLLEVPNFSYQDLVNTGADVLWLSDPAGGTMQYSPSEIDAIAQYAAEGHSILGTFCVFQWHEYDNRGLAPIFGLLAEIQYNTDIVVADDSFEILDTNHPLFRDVPNPYVTGGYEHAQVPADDWSWDPGDLGSATLLARTPDRRGIITWYETASYHAIFVSKMVEYGGNIDDTQFLYNALTIPSPGALVLLGAAMLSCARRRRE